METKENRPFSNSHFVGYINSVNPQFLTAHIPSSSLLSLYHRYGEKRHPGVVGSYVVIEGEEFGFIGRIIELNLAEKERLSLTERNFEKEDFHPTAKIEILISFNYFDPDQINKGLDAFPHIGAKVFSCHPDFLQRYLIKFGLNSNSDSGLFNFASLSTDENVSVSVSAQSLFSRHCAIVGTTGGGKSWTVAKLIEEMIAQKGKMVLIDATGEYKTFDGCPGVKTTNLGIDSCFHYTRLGIGDLFYLLRPSDKVQRPKLMEAIRSLKMLKINKGKDLKVKAADGTTLSVLAEDGILKKSGSPKKAYEGFYYMHIKDVAKDNLDLDIRNLARQVVQECIYDSDNRGSPGNYGGQSESDVSFCASLISRINNLVVTEIFQKVFGFNEPEPGVNDLVTILESFLASEDKLLRISLDGVAFDFQAREILVNAIGRNLLGKARKREFLNNKSLVVFVDEAHQFLNKTIQDEYFSAQPLDAFDLIAKECRKYGLFLCLATQMPRDIPIGTLSQMGTFIVHRLINKYDKEAVENACSSANKSSLSFLPILGRGEALLIGVDLPMPISVKIREPNIKPDSSTPQVLPPQI